MTDFNGNTSSKENLRQRVKKALQRIELQKRFDFLSGHKKQNHFRQRVNSALQQLKPLKTIDGWSALLKPEPLRRPRAHRAGVTMFDVALWTLVLIPVLVGVLSLYNGVVDSTRSAALRSQLTRAVAIIERDHIYSGVYGESDGDPLVLFLKNEGFTNKELGVVDGGLKFTSPYGTDIAITGSGSRTFTVTLADLPPSGCETAGMAFANKNSGLKSLVIAPESNDLTAAEDGITEAVVREACDKPENTVTLEF